MAQFYFDGSSTAVGQNDSSENTVSDDSLLNDNKWTATDSDEAAFVVRQAGTHRNAVRPINAAVVRNQVKRNLWQEGHFNENVGTDDDSPSYSAAGAGHQPSHSDDADVPLLSNVGIITSYGTQ